LKKAIVIGGGFAGLSAAAFLAKDGMSVTIIEKNQTIGGRARLLKTKGYSFDMGPSWYWMHDIYENFFNKFSYKSSDFYELIKLDPGFKVIFDSEEINIPANFKETCKIFEKYETDGEKKLKAFMRDAEKKYKIGLDFLYRSPGLSILELFRKDLIYNMKDLTLLSSYSKHVRKYFNNPFLIHILEFPVLFLGATAKNMPALYSLMSYSGIKQGTYYPIGGFNKIINSMRKVCTSLDVNIFENEEVLKINIKNNQAVSVKTNKRNIEADIIISSADYEHVENSLIPKNLKNYSNKYWENKQFSPSSLIFYLGINKKVNNLEHHNLFFDEDIKKNSEDIYTHKRWNKKPLFYVCCPSKTDNSLAPKGKENIFILMPIAAGLEDTEEIREKYFKIIINKIEKYTKQKLVNSIDYKKSYCINDFKNDYYAYKGNAYGLANTLSQTANLKPKIINKKIHNLFYTGQLTVPGPGVPPSIISGELVAKHIIEKTSSKS